MHTILKAAATALCLSAFYTPVCAENAIENTQETTIIKADSAMLTKARHNDAEGISLAKIIKQTDFSIKFGGYIVGKYSINDRDAQASNGGFDLRFVRLYLNGYCFQDFYYRLQMEVNDAPGTDKGPRIVDAFIEWQKWEALRIKLGQFKRSFGFENPYSPLDVGLGSYSQATMKIASIGDRNGEHKSSGRDVGLQLQGDLFKTGKGYNLLHYQVGLFNGQGINHKDKDNHKDLIGGLWLQPVKNLCIGGFGWNGTYVNENYDATNTNTYKSVKRVRYGFGMKYEADWTVRGEYMHSVGSVTTNAAAPNKADAWYATVGVPVMKGLKIYGRWDCYRNGKTWDDMKTDWGLTANYKPCKNLIFQLGYIRTYDRSAAIGQRYNTLDVQIYARF